MKLIPFYGMNLLEMKIVFDGVVLAVFYMATLPFILGVVHILQV
jgi:hypothetical protein